MVQLFGAGHVAVEVERAVVPLRVFEDHVAEIIQTDRKRLRPTPNPPVQFTTRRQARVEAGAGPWIGGCGVDLAGRFHLGRGQAIGTVTVLAGEDRGIEPTSRRVFDHSVGDAIQRIARRECRPVDGRYFSGGM